CSRRGSRFRVTACRRGTAVAGSRSAGGGGMGGGGSARGGGATGGGGAGGGGVVPQAATTMNIQAARRAVGIGKLLAAGRNGFGASLPRGGVTWSWSWTWTWARRPGPSPLGL